MISKILLTIGVIMVCMVMLANRATSKLREVPNPEVEKRKKHLRFTAYGFMFLMLVAAGIMLYLESQK